VLGAGMSIFGDPSPVVYWEEFSGVAADGETEVWSRLEGVSAPVGQLLNLTCADSGRRFRVVASNALGDSVVSGVTTLVVPPTAPVFLTDLAVTAGATEGTVVLSVSVVGDPAPALSWRTRANASADWEDLPGEVAETFVLTGLQYADNKRQFQVVAANEGGSAASKITTLSVPPKPLSFATDLPIVTPVAAGGTVTLFVEVSGDPQPLSYTWRRSTTGGKTWVILNGENRAELTIENVSECDDGVLYKVTANSAVASVPSITSNETSLLVEMPVLDERIAEDGNGDGDDADGGDDFPVESDEAGQGDLSVPTFVEQDEGVEIPADSSGTGGAGNSADSTNTPPATGDRGAEAPVVSDDVPLLTQPPSAVSPEPEVLLVLPEGIGGGDVIPHVKEGGPLRLAAGLSNEEAATAGGASVSYEWFFSSDGLGGIGEKVGEGASFSIAMCSSANAGWYCVRATGCDSNGVIIGSGDSAPFEVRVTKFDAYALTSKGARLDAKKPVPLWGAEKKFAKNGKPVFNWFKDGEALLLKGKPVRKTVPAVTVRESGFYSVDAVWTPAGGEARSARREWDVRILPVLKFHRAEGLLATGQLTVPVDVSSGAPVRGGVVFAGGVAEPVEFVARLESAPETPVIFRWYDGRECVRVSPVTFSQTDVFSATALTSKSKISVTVETEARVRDASGKETKKPLSLAKSKTFAVKAVVPPAVALVTPAAGGVVRAGIGKPLVLKIRISGTAKFACAWYYSASGDEDDFVVVTGENGRAVSKTTLTLKPAGKNEFVQTGRYRVVVRNAAGDAYAASLDILVAAAE